MPIYITLALTAAVFFSLNAITSKLVLKHAIKSQNDVIFYGNLSMLIFLPLLLFLTPLQNPLPGFWPLLLFSITFFIGVYFDVMALFRYDVSVLHPLFHFQTIFSVLFAFLFLGESYPFQSYFWIGFIIIGGFLVGVDEKFRLKAILSKNFLYFLVAIFFFALSDIFVKKTTVYMNVYNLKFWSILLLFIFSLPLIPILKQKRVFANVAILTIPNFFAFVGTVALFTAFSYNVTLAQPIGMFGSLFTLIISALLSTIKPEFLEHHPARVYVTRAIGVVLMLFAAIMISKV